MSKTYERIEETYRLMEARAVDGMFTGSSRDLERKDVNANYVSLTISHLSDMGCVVIVQRGNRHKRSVYKLLQAPTLEAYADRTHIARGKQAAAQREADILERLLALEDKMGKLLDLVHRLVNGAKLNGYD